jgi:hypothetical protein
MKASPMIAIAELVSTFDTSPRLARPMKMMPSTASRIGAILLAKNEISPSVLISFGPGVGASLPVTTASTSPACVECNTAWPSSMKIMCCPPRVPTGTDR